MCVLIGVTAMEALAGWPGVARGSAGCRCPVGWLDGPPGQRYGRPHLVYEVFESWKYNDTDKLSVTLGWAGGLAGLRGGRGAVFAVVGVLRAVAVRVERVRECEAP